MCLALWKIILVGMMIGFVTCLPAPPAPTAGGDSDGASGGISPGPEGDADLTSANTLGFGYGLHLGGLYGGYSPYYGGYNRGYYGGYRGFGYGYPSYGSYGGFW